MNPPERSIVFCVDEKSQIQALNEHRHYFPLRPGIPARQTHDYLARNNLFAALNILDGTVIGDCMPRHRYPEFIRFLVNYQYKNSSGTESPIVDSYGTHKHPRVEEMAKTPPEVLPTFYTDI